MRTLVVLYDNTTLESRTVFQLEDDLRTIFYLGEPFDVQSIAFATKRADTILLDDRVFDKVAPALDQRPWPLSLARQALDKRGTGPVDCVPQALPITPIPRTFPKPVLFIPSNDTHVKMFHLLAKRIPNHKFIVFDRGEHADTSLTNLEESFLHYHKRLREQQCITLVNRARQIAGKIVRWIGGTTVEKILVSPMVRSKQWLENRIYYHLDALNPSVVVLGIDWGNEERKICEWAKKRAIPTVCIQEGPQDFDMPGYNQMQTVDHVFVQGAITLRYLKRKAFVITGNPRLSDLVPIPTPKRPVVMINANFTYGIYEDWRDRWIKAVVEACRAVGVDFFISRHARDHGDYRDLPVLDSSAFKLHDQIAKSSILITRFSQVVYEAMLLGRRVLYYNPHGETKRTLTEDQTGALIFAKTPDELRNALKNMISRDETNDKVMADFLTLHCGLQDGQTVERCLTALAAVANGRIVVLR